MLATMLPGSAYAVWCLYRDRWPIGVSREGHRIRSVKVQPRRKDSSLVAWEAPWRENKTVEPSDTMLRKAHAQHTRLQRAVNADGVFTSVPRRDQIVDLSLPQPTQYAAVCARQHSGPLSQAYRPPVNGCRMPRGWDDAAPHVTSPCTRRDAQRQEPLARKQSGGAGALRAAAHADGPGGHTAGAASAGGGVRGHGGPRPASRTRSMVSRDQARATGGLVQ